MTKGGRGAAKTGVLMKAEGRIIAAGRLPGHLVGDLLEIPSDQQFHKLELPAIDPVASSTGLISAAQWMNRKCRPSVGCGRST